MKCKECGSEYPSEAYFPVPEICENCFKQKDANTQNELIMAAQYQDFMYNQTIEQRRVGLGRRFGALAIDCVFLIAIYMIIFFASGMFEDTMMLNEQMLESGLNVQATTQLGYQFMENHLGTILFTNFMFILYFSLEILVGASLGKLMLGITIAEQNGNQATSIQLIKRYLFKCIYLICGLFSTYFYLISYIKFLEYALLFLTIVSFFYILTQKKQAFHDLFAYTAVFRKRDLEQVENTIPQNN